MTIVKLKRFLEEYFILVFIFYFLLMVFNAIQGTNEYTPNRFHKISNEKFLTIMFMGPLWIKTLRYWIGEYICSYFRVSAKSTPQNK